MADKFWLLKAEPDSRIVKGKDVKFSVDDFEAVKTSAWEGVRNYEARNLMKEMKNGERTLFYHSNCKNPELMLQYLTFDQSPTDTAWDTSHPYYDPKSDEKSPKWFMVDLTFSSRAKNFVPLALLRHIADNNSLPKEVSYIGDEGAQAIKTMDLVTRGRLSVQRVSEEAWNVINLLAEKGGWDEAQFSKTKAASNKTKAKPEAKAPKHKKNKAQTETLAAAPSSSSVTEPEVKPRTAAKKQSSKKAIVEEESDPYEDGASPAEVTASEFSGDDDDDDDYGSKKKKKTGAAGEKRKAKSSGNTPRRTRARRS
ncbi:DUF55-domain-containing protein [Dendrothele bispora CBS 962.96]|uniref:DUF55-domain-containing protein n=1 Tax=Dendrothele bispora (strain CBS 962.96) TaxID=1314807 RepID=A0A4S8MIQ1_DENBC|nr:DUF55-domain-containing protein [Dendrothele bispora CBS 962.96]